MAQGVAEYLVARYTVVMDTAANTTGATEMSTATIAYGPSTRILKSGKASKRWNVGCDACNLSSNTNHEGSARGWVNLHNAAVHGGAAAIRQS
jgi:hypothetical protein